MSDNRPIINLDDITADILAGNSNVGGPASFPGLREEPVEAPQPVQHQPFIKINFDVDEEGAITGFVLESHGVGTTKEAFLNSLEVVMNSIRGGEGERVAPSELDG